MSLVRHMSLETFASFAELTTHESVVAASVTASDHTRQTVVEFLSRVSQVAGKQGRIQGLRRKVLSGSLWMEVPH